MTNKRGQIYERNVRHAYLFLRRHFGSRSTVIPSPRGPDLFIFKMAAMLQIPRFFPRISCLGSAKVVQCPRPGQKNCDKSQQILRYARAYVPSVNPKAGVAADKCIISPFNHVVSPVFPSESTLPLSVLKVLTER